MTAAPTTTLLDPRPLGRSQLVVGGLCLGGSVFGWTVDEERSFELLEAFVAGGGTFIDTADIYSEWVPGNTGGDSERIIGRWLAQRPGGRPEGLVIATKVGKPMPDGRGLSRDWILRSAERSRENLGVEAIDLYYAHEDVTDTPLEEALGAFDELVRTGVVRALGASNYGAQRLARALAVSEREGFARYDVLQPDYNLVDRVGFEDELQALCVREELAVTPYYSLAAGFLTGKYQRGGAMPDTPRANGMIERYGDERGWRVVEALGDVAREAGATESQVAIAWLAAQPGVVAPIASATSSDQLDQLLGAARLQLTQQQLDRLTVASAA